MIISSRRRSKTPFGRLLSIFRNASVQHNAPILDEESFLFEIKKERARIDRRVGGGEFALIFVTWLDGANNDPEPLANGIRQRLRITDTVGWKGNQLAVLLPETAQDGAKCVANDIVKIARIHNFQVDTEILTYPWDDPIANGSSELDGRCGAGNVDVATRPVDPGHADFENTSFSVMPPTPFWKRTTDIVGASCGLILLSPVFLLAGIAIKLNSRGPVFFRQQREGKDGAAFGIIKFRTMSIDAEQKKASLRIHSEQDGPAFKIGDDPRITKVGRYLRKSCVDELPQLVNVLLGDMSLVGPRPLPIDESANCQIWQRKRLEVMPGITCIWQVHGGRETKFVDWMRMDLEYVRRRSFLLDLKLIVQTVCVAILHRGSV
jgi:lipopolysaccharide/colanic/teichoic acid biosynthesis glycosyltransferase